MIARIAFIGGGIMAEAIARGIVVAGVVQPEHIVVSDPNVERLLIFSNSLSIDATWDNRLAARGAEIVVLANKSQQFAEVAASLAGGLDPKQTVVSIMAGVSLAALVRGLGHDRVVRVMPNTPARIGAGMSVWTGTTCVDLLSREKVQSILTAIGRELFVDDEKYLDMATAINGSGPAYVFLFIEAMIDAAVHLGLTRTVAETLVIQTVFGSARMAREGGEHPAHIRNLVTSPGGTTAAALAVLEDGRLRAVVDRAIFAAYERSQSLGR